MELRDKETGEVKFVEYIELRGVCPVNFGKYKFNSIAELNDKFEDYKPVEPLIEDPKARKVFREWAELFGAEQFLVNHLFDSRRKTTLIGSTDIATEPCIELPGHIGEDSKNYTGIELCGEEAE